ncbi:MAG: DUF1266 domain-containing protein [Candidatus Accumulibacter sp.]|jgi:hypothetical protein|nr:DUF1266 domain-containing protein [Accumulibacter sp.]
MYRFRMFSGVASKNAWLKSGISEGGMTVVFGFLRELKEAWAEGIAEAKEELAQEAAMEGMAKSSLAMRLNEKFESLPPEEIFSVLLGSPLREIFVDDASRAKKDDRKPYYSFSMEIPDDKSEEMAGYLKRDFDVDGRSTLRENFSEAEGAVYTYIAMLVLNLEKLPEDVAVSLQELSLASEEEWPVKLGALKSIFKPLLEGKDLSPCKPPLALWMARLSYMTTVSVALGYITKPTAYTWLGDIVRLGFPLFDSWQDYAESYTRGEKEDGTNNALGRAIIEKKVVWLLNDAGSPWSLYPWPKELPEDFQGKKP